MPLFSARSGEIYFQQQGARANPPVLLIHGVGCQLVEWPDTLIDALVDAGYRAIVFDHRDVGLSHEVDADIPSIEDLFRHCPILHLSDRLIRLETWPTT